MNKYNEVEVKTAKNLLEHGYKWIVRYEIGRLIALSEKPIKSNNNLWTTPGNYVCVGRFVPIFQSVRFDDKEPTSLESIVHPQILDDVEKRYLSAVIKPFRDKVRSISKVVEDIAEDHTNCHLFIRFIDASDDMSFPTFREGEMYEGMERNKRYTLKELGL